MYEIAELHIFFRKICMLSIYKTVTHFCIVYYIILYKQLYLEKFYIFS